MGERELILDEMSVDDVMRIVGASGGAAGGPPASAVSSNRETAPASTESSGDWREVLRAAGGEPARATNLAKPAPPPPPPAPSPPAPDEYDDAAAPEDAVAGPPAYVMRPPSQTIWAFSRIRPDPSHANEARTLSRVMASL